MGRLAKHDSWFLAFALTINRLSGEQIVENTESRAVHVGVAAGTFRAVAATRAEALALGLFLTPPA